MGQISVLDHLQRTPMKSLNLNLLLWNAWYLNLCCTCSVAKPCPTLCDPMDCSTPSFPVLHYLPEFAHTHVHWVSNAIQLSHPLLRLFSCLQSFLAWQCLPMSHIRWPKYWSFSFSISPSYEYSGLISFRIDLLNVNKAENLSPM